MTNKTASVASPFISAGDLAKLLAASEPPALIFVSAEPGEVKGLIPGSVPTALPTHYAGKSGGEAGRLPLPNPEEVYSWLSKGGISDSAEIVVYDGASGTAAARAWWVLNWVGRKQVRILDGGLKAWQAKSLESDGRIGVAADTAPSVFQEIGTGDIAADPHAYKLIDARGKAAYSGTGDAPSHLPGAINSPASEWQNADGTLLPFDQRQAKAQELGLFDAAQPVVAYCGSGVAAAYWIAAVHDLGVKASLYAGSWSAWSANPERLRISEKAQG